MCIISNCIIYYNHLNVVHWIDYGLNRCQIYVAKGAEPPEGTVGYIYKNLINTFRELVISAQVRTLNFVLHPQVHCV